jgi:hypothetical protein
MGKWIGLQANEPGVQPGVSEEGPIHRGHGRLVGQRDPTI